MDLLRGDPINAVNYNLFKNVKVSEKVNFRLEAQVLSLFNTSYYGTQGNHQQRSVLGSNRFRKM
jgi:hypothetical protein